MARMKRRAVFLILAGIVVAGSLPLPTTGASAGSRPLTIDQLIDIKHPSNPVWSRDSRRVAFLWERAGVMNLYVGPADGSVKPVAVTSDGEPTAGAFWSADSQTLYFLRAGTPMQVPADASQPPRAVWEKPPGRGLTVSRDGTRVAYLTGDPPEVHVRSLVNGSDR